jgi:hypothetical protein
VAEEWLDGSFSDVPSDEQLVRAHHVRGAALSGASIACTRGVFPGELQAIARTLAMFPASFTLHIHSDSEASLVAIHSYESLNNERKRMRMAAHTLLQLIHHLLGVREKAGGSVHWHHIRAHTTNTDIHSVGNRLSDYQANLARARPDHPTPLTLRELPLSACETYLRIIDDNTGLQLIDDVRRTSLSQLKQAALTHWQAKRDGRELFASRAVLDLGRIVLKQGSAQQQATFVHIATNSIHFLWASDAAAGRESVQRLQCEDCSAADERTVELTLSHLTDCPSAVGVDYREQLQRDILQLLQTHGQTATWLREHNGSRLSSMLLDLFPMSATVAASPPLDPGRRHHLTSAMCGVLSSSQLTAAARTVGFTDPLDLPIGVRVMQQLCLLCIGHIGRVFSLRKELALV